MSIKTRGFLDFGAPPILLPITLWCVRVARASHRPVIILRKTWPCGALRTPGEQGRNEKETKANDTKEGRGDFHAAPPPPHTHTTPTRARTRTALAPLATMVTKSLTGTLVIAAAALAALMAHGTALSAVLAALSGPGGASLSDGSMADAATGLVFPATQKFRVGGGLSLLGVGIRKKAVINVYSVGFYGSKAVARAVEGRSGKKACGAAISAKGPKAVQLTFVMGVGAAKMADALSNVDGVSQETKDAFGDMIITGMGGKMLKGETMTIEWKGSDVVVVTARGKLIGEMKDRDLHRGLLDIYLGPKSVSPSLKASIGENA